MWFVRFFLFLFLSSLSSCAWFRKETVVVSSHGIDFGERYYSARLVEKLKNVDGPSIKDPALLLALKTALTEELIIEGALFAWAKYKNIHFSDQDLQAYLYRQVGEGMDLKTVIHEAAPTTNLLRDAIYIQLIHKKLQKHLITSAPPTDVELMNYYEKNKALFDQVKIDFRQIVLAEEHEATTLLQHLIEKKISFVHAEKKFSIVTDPKVRPSVDSKSSPLASQLSNSNPGLQSRVFQSPHGFHIIHVLRVKKGAAQAFAALRPHVLTHYKRERGAELYLQWQRDQVKNGSISVNQSRIMALTAEYQESF